MRYLLIFFLLFFGGCCPYEMGLSEEKVRVIASLDVCYELTLRNSEVINNIRVETDYRLKQISGRWKEIYANQQRLVREAPFYCDLWLSNQDFISETKMLLK